MTLQQVSRALCPARTADGRDGTGFLSLEPPGAGELTSRSLKTVSNLTVGIFCSAVLFSWRAPP